VERFVVTAIFGSVSSSLSPLEQAIQRAAVGAGGAVEQVLGLGPAGTGVGAGARATVSAPSGEASPRATAQALRRGIAAALAARGQRCDLAVQPLAARAEPRLLVMDMDSTLITIEVIDELARRHGVGAEVAEVTERAMRGELDFEASLRARVSRLAGLSAHVLEDVAAGLTLSDGAEELISRLLARGAAVAIASGGFTFAAHALQRRLGLTAAHANQLEIRDGALTGRVLGQVVTAERKAEIVRELMAAAGLRAEQAVAIGDGANDRLMVASAGLGVAFRAKPALALVADATIELGGLDRVLQFVALPATLSS
jgi:phosphoserine phosphatase